MPIRLAADNHAIVSATNVAWLGPNDFRGSAVLSRDADSDNTNNGVIQFRRSDTNMPLRLTFDYNNAEIEVRVAATNGANANVVVKVGRAGDLNANGGQWAVGEQLVVTISYTASTKTLSVWITGPSTNGTFTGSATHTGNIGAPDDGWIIGYVGGAGECFLGDVSLKFDTGTMDADDHADMVEALLGAGMAGGGSLEKLEAVFEAIGGSDFDVGFRLASGVGASGTAGGGASAGAAVTTTNLVGRTASGSSMIGAHTLASVTSGITHVSPDSKPPSGGWAYTPAATGVSQALIDAESTYARMLGRGDAPEGIAVVLVVDNSRGIGSNDGGTPPRNGSRIGGMERARIAQLAGSVLAPCSLSTGSPRLFWGQASAPPSSGTVLSVSGGAGASSVGDFSRDGTGSSQAGSLGTGAGLFLAAGASVTQTMESHAENTGLVTPDKAVKVSAQYLAFPGAGDYAFRASKGAATNAQTPFGDATTIDDADTAAQSRVYDPDPDSYNAGTRTLVVTLAQAPSVGHVAYVAERTSKAEISAVSSAGNVRTLTLRHAFQTAPQEGDTIHFGPQELRSFELEIAGDVDNRFRGLQLTMSGGPGYWATKSGVLASGSGWAFGAIGAGGKGHQQQIEANNTGNAAALAALAQPALALVSAVTQDADNSHLEAHIDEILEGAEDAEVFIFGGEVHLDSNVTMSDKADVEARGPALALATARGFGAIDLSNHPGLGTIRAQFVRGFREDGQHLSGAGADAWAAALLTALADLTEAEPPEPAEGEPEITEPAIVAMLLMHGPPGGRRL
ncbi:MAG: hypothetical protein IBJ10_10030 [Phycisphaerales bacterium]|nr:hypothetical protein [Phycisphaerales bacterium]